MDETRRRDDLAIQLMSERIGTIHADVVDLKSSIKDSVNALNEVVTRLARMDERQSHMTQAYDRLVKEVDKAESKFSELEKRVDALEKEVPMQNQIRKWILTAVWSLAMGAIWLAGKMLGLL